MRLLFSTDNLPVNTRFKRWLETLEEQRLPLEQERLGSGPFEAKLESATLGPLTMTRVSDGPLRSEAPPRTLRPLGNQSLYLKMPRERLESVLGPARRYAALTVGAELATATLAMSFFEELSRMHHRLDPVTGARMGSIGVDLIVASIAERIALDAPLPASGDILVQRAKAHVEAHLGDPALDPPRLAAAVRVSLRRLQALFDERGQHVSDWIWQRRLEVAADRLADPTCTHLTIDTLAGGCGFASRAHFSRRFKGRFGLAPSDFRRAVGLGLQ